MSKNLNLTSEWCQILSSKFVSNKYPEKSINKSHQDHLHSFGLIHQSVSEWRVKFKILAPNISTKVIIIIIIITIIKLLQTLPLLLLLHLLLYHRNNPQYPGINFKYIIITTPFNIHIQVCIYFRRVDNGNLSIMLLGRIYLLLFYLTVSFFKKATVVIVSIATHSNQKKIMFSWRERVLLK